MYQDWMRQYILHRGKRHPLDMGIAEIRQYLGSSQFGPSAEPEQRVETERAIRFNVAVGRTLRRIPPRRL